MTDKIDAVQRMQDYIQTHLYETITLGELARTACYSPFYSARIFRELTGISPYEYIRKLRLSQSALRLRDEKCRVTDIAYGCGYQSVDGYQRAFFHEFGCNPHEYAVSPIPLSLFIPYGVKFRSLWKEHIETMKANTVFLQVIEKTQRKIIFKRGIHATDYRSYCNEVGCDVWGILTSMKSLCGEPVCLWMPHTSEYVQGVEVATDDTTPIPDGFDTAILPAAKYLMFQGVPFAEEDFCAAIEAVQSAIAAYDPSFIGYAWDFDNPKIQLEPRGERGYIELVPIK